jgi:hypothetical protein
VPLITLPTRTDESLGREKEDRPAPLPSTPDLRYDVPASLWNQVMNAIAGIAEEVGVHQQEATATSLNTRVHALEEGGGGGGGGPVDAEDVSFTPVGTIAATDAQAAIAEVASDAAAALASHVGTGGTAHANVIASGAAGFMTGSDKAKLDGVEAAADVTDFANVSAALAAASASVSLNAQRLTSVADPSSAQDAATKAYVDALAQGLSIKQSVRVATTANVDLSTALENGDSLDGVTLATGDRVLVKDQSTASQNGIYVVQASGAAVRATDFDASGDVARGAFVFVQEGTTHADSGWVLTTDGAITVGTTALAFTQFSGAGQITAGAGLTKTGNTINAVAHADGSIVANADSLQVGVLATDAQHGNRGGGALHANATTSVAGFMSAADKTKINGVDDPATYVGEAGMLALWQYGVLLGLTHGGDGDALFTDGTQVMWDTLANRGAFTPGPWSYLYGFSAANYYESASAPTTGARGSLIAGFRLTDTRDFTEQVIVGFSNSYYASFGAHIGVSGDTVTFSVVDSGGTRRTIQQTGVQAGKWYVFIGTWDGTGANLDMRLLVQARQNSSSTAGAAGAITTGAAPLCVGCANGDGTHPATYAQIVLAGFRHDVVLDLDDARQIVDLLHQTQEPPVVDTGARVFDTLLDPLDPGAVWDDQVAANTLAEVGDVSHRSLIEGTGTVYVFPLIA